MTKFKIEIIIESPFDLSQEEIDFYRSCYIEDHKQLFVHSNEMGDSIGEVLQSKVLSVEPC